MICRKFGYSLLIPALEAFAGHSQCILLAIKAKGRLLKNDAALRNIVSRP
jgi:hypothetical protein